MDKSTFFIGICPPHRIEEDVHRIKEEFRQKYGLTGAFRSKAHITLQMPFNLSIKKVDEFILQLSELLKGKKPFEIQLTDFGKFEPRVVFIQVDENRELDAHQKSIEKFLKQFQIFDSTHKNNGFNPHITIAFRDLKKPIFYKVWNEVKERSFTANFLANSVTVFKHNGESWDVFKELKIGEP